MADQRKSTIAALLEEKPKRGRPPRAVSRQNVYVALTAEQKGQMQRIAEMLPASVRRADVPDLAAAFLSARLESLRRTVADRNREMPEGITDLESLYLLWDLPLPPRHSPRKWTSVRLSPQQAIQLGRARGVLNALFGVTRSQVFELALSVLFQAASERLAALNYHSLAEIQAAIPSIYL